MVTLGELLAATASVRGDAPLRVCVSVTMPDGRVLHVGGGVEAIEVAANEALGAEWVYLVGADDLRGDGAAMVELGLLSEEEFLRGPGEE